MVPEYGAALQMMHAHKGMGTGSAQVAGQEGRKYRKYGKYRKWQQPQHPLKQVFGQARLSVMGWFAVV
jgi:hypothetical protein